MLPHDTKPDLARTTCQIDFIADWANVFYRSKNAENSSKHTLDWYRQQLGHFLNYCQAQVITRMSEITPAIVREFILHMADAGHNPGGQHAAYRAVKAFLRWYELEAEPDNWHNPIRKVKAPKVPVEPLEPADLGEIDAILSTCKDDFAGKRDRALILTMLDTGTRASETLAVNRDDIDSITGSIVIRHAKGSKWRTVFVERTSKKALRQYLKLRNDKNSALWVTGDRERLKYAGLRAILTRRSNLAGIENLSAHAIRRAFALASLRAGVDLITLARLMGHADLTVLKRYLKQVDADLQTAHSKASPVETMRKGKK